MPRDNRCMYIENVYFYIYCSDCVLVYENVCCVAAIVKNSFFSLVVLKYVVCLCSGCCVFCLYCEAWSSLGSQSTTTHIATHKTNRHINRATHNIQGYDITLTTSHVQEAIKQSKNNNSQGPDKSNIRHLKHIGPLGLTFLMSMFKTALNKNIIPHTWKLANIVPIPKPNKDTDKGTSYRPISLLSVIAKTLEKSLLPYITANIPTTPMQHGYKTQHSTVTALHTINNTVAKGFNQMAPPARTITVALDMSKAFDTIIIIFI